MSGFYMLDTDICSYIIKETSGTAVQKFWEHRDDALCISAATFAELLYGARRVKSERLYQKIMIFRTRFHVIPFDEEAARLYAEIRCASEAAGTPMDDDMDIEIACCARRAGAVLVSNNTRHFSAVPGLTVENWAE